MVESAKKIDKWAVLQQVFVYVKPHTGSIALGLTALVANSITNLSFPWLIGQAVDIAARKTPLEQNRRFVYIAAAALSVGSLASLVRVYCLGSATDRIALEMKSDVFSSYMNQEVECVEETSSGALLTVLDKDVEEAAELCTERVASCLRSLNSSINGSILLFTISPQLFGITIGIVPVIGVAAITLSKLTSRIATQCRAMHSEIMSFAVERIRHISTVRLNNMDAVEVERYISQHRDLSVATRRMLFQRGIFMSFINLATNASLMGVLYVGGRLLAAGGLTTGQLTQFALQSGFVGLGFSGLSTAYADFNKALAAADRCLTLRDKCRACADTPYKSNASNPVESNAPTAEGMDSPLTEVAQLVRFENVTFAYRSRPDTPVMRQLSLHIPRNSLVAITGRSGIGKSTLQGLLSGLYSPQQGEIYFDNKSVATMDRRWLREQVGVVEQSSGLMSGTVLENLKYGINASLEEVQRVTELTNAHSFICTLPQQYDTEVGSDGHLLSGGQKARIAISRCLLKKPTLMLLDEPTAALDAENERMLIELLSKMKEQITIVVFTHSDDIVHAADMIYRLQDGGVVLCSKNGSKTDEDHWSFSSQGKLKTDIMMANEEMKKAY